MGVKFLLLILLAYSSAKQIDGTLPENTIDSNNNNGKPESKSSSQNKVQVSTSQAIVCYDYTGQGGDQFRAYDPVTELWRNGFDNKIESCCFDGFWILYGQDSFNNATSVQVLWSQKK